MCSLRRQGEESRPEKLARVKGVEGDRERVCVWLCLVEGVALEEEGLWFMV